VVRNGKPTAATVVVSRRDDLPPSGVPRELADAVATALSREPAGRGSAADLAARYADAAPRGEVVLVVGGAPEGSGIEDERAADAVRRLVDAGAKPREAARVVASLTGASANALYRALT